MTEPIHVVDATMFWSATGGGVRRYLLTKHDWLARRSRLAAHDRRCRAATRVAGRASPAFAAAARQRRLPPAAAPRRDRPGAARSRARPDRSRRSLPRRLGRARRRAQRSPSRRSRPATPTSRRWPGSPPAPRLGALRARVRRGAMPRHVYRGFDLVLAPSRSMRSHLLDWGVERVALQPLGVDTAAFHPGRARAGLARRASASPPNARVLVYAGRFAAEKHLDVLADAVARLGPPHVLLAIGAGPMPPARRAGARRCRSSPTPPRWRRSWPSADAFVHAGDQETFGLSALEAMACGTPVVVRKAEGLAELAEGGAAASRSSAARRAAFAEAIAALLARRSRGAAARRPGARRGQRLGAGAARPARPLPAPARRPGGVAVAQPRGAAPKPRPCRRHDEPSNATTPSRFESERFVCVVLHDVAPLDPRRLHAHAAPRSPRSPTCR